MISEAGADGFQLVRNPVFEEWSGAAQPDGFVDAISWRFEQDVAERLRPARAPASSTG